MGTYLKTILNGGRGEPGGGGHRPRLGGGARSPIFTPLTELETDGSPNSIVIYINVSPCITHIGWRLIGAEVRVGSSFARNQPCWGLAAAAEVTRVQKITKECLADTRGRIVSVQIRNRRDCLTVWGEGVLSTKKSVKRDTCTLRCLLICIINCLWGE